ncbi:MAG TPA: hypothetical protein VFC85_07725 [Verrucomicrobiae bacterium]|nr:hypothetical protein [Verrucomicrobiae bacterium]
MITNGTTQSAASAANDIRDIKPPIGIPNGWEGLWWALGALALFVIASLIWRHIHRRMTQISIAAPVPAHIRAKQKLEEALAFISQPKEFCVLVSDTIRVYLEERFDFRAPERTTEEFLRELGETNLLSPEQKESLGKFLESCDLVKFAKYEPGESELRGLHSAAVKMVEETMPAPAPTDIVSSENVSSANTAPPVLQTIYKSAPQKPASHIGIILAIVGTALQLAPFIWVIAYLVTSFRLFNLANNPEPIDVKHPFDAFNATISKMDMILGEGAIIFLLGLLAGFVGLIMLITALTILRYRAEWFFWFLLIYGLILCVGFPFTTAFGIFFFVYCLTKRGEFLNRT